MIHWYMSRLRAYGFTCWYDGHDLATITTPLGTVYRNQDVKSLDRFLCQAESKLEPMPTEDEWLSGAKSPERVK